jgi:hypothetical protein
LPGLKTAPAPAFSPAPSQNSNLRKTQSLANKTSASFQGNESAGKFSARSVTGVYRVRGNRVTITITDRPFLVPWSIIESKVRRFFT